MPVLGEGGIRSVMIFGVLARLRSGLTVSQAASEASARAREAPGLAQAALALFGNDGEIAISGATARDVMTREARPGLLLLLAAVVLLLVTALASVANVQVARAAQRRREVALRAALGAGASRLTRQWVVESVVVGILGGGLGVALAAGLHRVIPVLLPAEFPRIADVRLDGVVVAGAACVTIAASLLSGFVPAWLGRRETLAEVLGQDGLTAVGARTRTPVACLRAAVIVSQVAVACVLLVATALLGRSFIALIRADRGYDPRNVLTARVPLPANSTFAQYEAVLAEVQETVASVPGVVHVAFGNALPFVTSGGFRGLTIPSPLDPARTIDVQTAMRAVTPDFFKTLRLRLVAGRPLAATDTGQAPPVVVVNRTFAAQYLGGDAIGRRMALNLNGRVDWEVVGVVDDMRQGGMSNASPGAFGGVTDPPLPELFFATTQWRDPIPEIVVAVRTTNEPSAHVAHLRTALQDAAPALALDGVTTMEERLTTSLALPRLYAVVLAVLGVLALGVAGVGVFGVVAAAIAQRTREIGVRTALGATPVDVVRLVARQIATSLTLGVVLGLAAALATARTVANQFYGVSPMDPWSFLAVPLLLVAVAVAACALPLARALRIDPLTALRSQ
jgi:putative ABC transport system permease protein